MYAGICTIAEKWLGISKGETLHVITDRKHLKELDGFRRWADAHGIRMLSTVLGSADIQKGAVIENMAQALMESDVIIGASDSSFITTKAVSDAVKAGARFLSLPLSTSGDSSILESPWLHMDPEKCRTDALFLIEKLDPAEEIHVVTEAGTDLYCHKKGRTCGYYNGQARRGGEISSLSFELFIPIEETKTKGVLVLDGSLGYRGIVKQPIHIEFIHGRLTIRDTHSDAGKLQRYMESFSDARMYFPGEFGIGLNRLSECRGVSYIEDESSYGTFHLGMGRNLTLGGVQDAAGHFDIVTRRPDIYADGRQIISKGSIIS